MQQMHSSFQQHSSPVTSRAKDRQGSWRLLKEVTKIKINTDNLAQGEKTEISPRARVQD